MTDKRIFLRLFHIHLHQILRRLVKPYSPRGIFGNKRHSHSLLLSLLKCNIAVITAQIVDAFFTLDLVDRRIAQIRYGIENVL